MITERLKAWFEDESAVADYRQGIYLLERSGVMDLIRRLGGTPTLYNYGASLEVMAGQAHQAIGFNNAIDQLQYFEQSFRTHAIASLEPDFGAESEALRKGHLRPEDLK